MKTNKFRTPKQDCENTIAFTCSNDAIEPILELLEQLRILGSIGSSRNITVEWGGDKNKKIFFDGDGRHRLNNVSVNGLTLKQWEDEWKRLSDIKTKYDLDNNNINQNENDNVS